MNLVMGDGLPNELGGDEDTRLLVAARRDPTAFADLYSRNSDRVVAYFYRRILCPHTAVDLAAETFAQAYESRKRFNPDGGSGRGWLFGIAGNLYMEWLRREAVSDKARRRLGIVTPLLVEEDLERVEGLVDLLPLRDALQDALVSLSPRLRDAVVLRVALSWPYEDVAQELGCSVGAARVRVSRGLDQLLELMEQA